MALFLSLSYHFLALPPLLYFSVPNKLIYGKLGIFL